LQAIKSKEVDLAIGNIFGSNAFNILLVVGIPGLIAPLVAGEVVMELGLVVMLAASLILFVNGLARQVQKWEGVMMILFFAFFIVKLVEFV
jgi:cation:H+ antiporter